MGVWRFRAIVGAIVYAYLLAASPQVAILGAFIYFPIAIALSPLSPGNGLTPSWAPTIGFWAAAFFFAYRTGRGLYRAWAASNAGDHRRARAAALNGLVYASIPSIPMLSMMSLADAWPA